MKKSPIVAIWIAWFVTAANLIVGKFAVPYITSALFLFLSIYIFSGVNFSNIMKKDKVIEARLLVMTLSIALSYLLTNFVIDFLNLA